MLLRWKEPNGPVCWGIGDGGGGDKAEAAAGLLLKVLPWPLGLPSPSLSGNWGGSGLYP